MRSTSHYACNEKGDVGVGCVSWHDHQEVSCSGKYYSKIDRKFQVRPSLFVVGIGGEKGVKMSYRIVIQKHFLRNIHLIARPHDHFHFLSQNALIL